MTGLPHVADDLERSLNRAVNHNRMTVLETTSDQPAAVEEEIVTHYVDPMQGMGGHRLPRRDDLEHALGAALGIAW